MNATSATAAANPETQVLQHVIDISRTWAKRPNKADIAARTRATRCRTSAYVIHFTTTVGIWANDMSSPSN